jgi:hypothetical protein
MMRALLLSNDGDFESTTFCLQDIDQGMQDIQSSTQRRYYVDSDLIQHPCLSFADMRPCAARSLHKPSRLQM